jgi:hypothetical protein
MSEISFGNTINRRLRSSLFAIFGEGEVIQLTHSSFGEMAKRIELDPSEVFTLTYPIGLRPDKTPMLGNTEYSKDEIQKKVAQLSDDKLALNGIYQLVTIIEALLGDIVRLVILKYPNKIGSKRSIKSVEVLNSESIEEIHLKVANGILNELSYKSPTDFAEESGKFLSINLLECPAYHRYIEVKATRDIHIHNCGIVNDLYLSKATTHARAKLGQFLPVKIHYYLENYESCLQLIEWLQIKLHEVWPSSDFEERKNNQEIKEIEDTSV